MDKEQGGIFMRIRKLKLRLRAFGKKVFEYEPSIEAINNYTWFMRGIVVGEWVMIISALIKARRDNK